MKRGDGPKKPPDRSKGEAGEGPEISKEGTRDSTPSEVVGQIRGHPHGRDISVGPDPERVLSCRCEVDGQGRWNLFFSFSFFGMQPYD